MDTNLQTISGLKSASFTTAMSLHVPVRNGAGLLIGKLVPIGDWIVTDAEKVGKMVAWRNLAKKMFPTQSAADDASTLAYLKKSAIDNNRGLLFGIFDPADNFVGHIGVTDVTATQFELAHLIKGTDPVDAKLILNSEICLIDWCFTTFGGDSAVVEIMSYNWIVSMLHKEIGFEIAHCSPLRKTENDNGIAHEVVSPEAANVKYTIVKMELRKARFYECVTASGLTNAAKGETA